MTVDRDRRAMVVDRVLIGLGVVAFAVAVWFLWPHRWGGEFSEVVVSGHSMEPTYHTGDLVVTRRADRYAIGDSVVYRIPRGQPGSGILVVHRVIGHDRHGYVLQGDNRATSDQWRPTDQDVVGHVVAVVPAAGKVILGLSDPWILAALFGLIITLWWWPERDPVSIQHEEGDPVTDPQPEPVIRIERVAFLGPPRDEPWWADEVPSPVAAAVPAAVSWWSDDEAVASVDAARADHSMPSAPTSSEWAAITASASVSSDSSS